MKEQQIQAKKIKELEAQGYYVIKLIKNNIMEIWKNIENYEGYQVSNFGNIKSLSKKVKCKNGFRTTKEKILKLKKSKLMTTHQKLYIMASQLAAYKFLCGTKTKKKFQT